METQGRDCTPCDLIPLLDSELWRGAFIVSESIIYAFYARKLNLSSCDSALTKWPIRTLNSKHAGNAQQEVRLSAITLSQ